MTKRDSCLWFIKICILGKIRKKLCKDTLRCKDARFIKRTRTKNFMHVKFYHSNKEKFAAKMFEI